MTFKIIVPKLRLGTEKHVEAGFIPIAKSFFRHGKPYNLPCPPLKNGGNYKELLLKSFFGKGGFRGI
jgi:hypothetical protein